MGPWPSSQAVRTQSGPVGPVIDAMSGSPRQLPHSSARHRVPVNPMGLLDTPPLKRSDNKMNPPPLNRPGMAPFADNLIFAPITSMHPDNTP